MLPSNVPEFETKSPPPTRGGGPRFSGGLLLTLLLLVALIAIVAFGVTHLPTAAPARPTPVAANAPAPVAPVATAGPTTQAAATAAAAGSPADQATAQAIQDVVRRLDEAQAQAIATGNSQLMAPTASPEFYAEEVAANQNLVDSGVTEVKLVNIEWDQILVNGDSATATAFETWTTSFDDGTTLQSRDRNVYTLVRDGSGNWKVQADDHPDQQQ